MLSNENIEFDVCFVTFNTIDNDARTINMARVLSESGKKVCIVGLAGNVQSASPSFKRGQGGVFHYQLNNPSHPKMWNRWFSFSTATKNIKPLIRSKIFIAEDLYSLHIVRRFVKKQNAKFIYDSREIYSALGPLYKNKIKQKILSFYEKYFIRYIDEVIVSGKLDGEYLRKYFKHDLPYHVIMNLPFYRKPVNSNIIREKYNIKKDDIAVIYQGMILPGRGIDKMIEALPYIENAHFFILGEGGYIDEYKKKSDELKVSERVHFCGLIPYEELHDWTCSADIGLVFIEPISFSYELALPNKLFEYCMAGIPSLVSDLPAMREVLLQDKIGLLIKPDIKVVQIAESIRIIYEDREQYRANCKNAAKKYNYEGQKEIILDICEVK